MPAYKIRNASVDKQPQMQMASDCAFRASQVPPAKYDQLSGFKLTRSKIYEHKIHPAKKVENPYKIVKSKLPDAGTYNTGDSFKKT